MTELPPPAPRGGARYVVVKNTLAQRALAANKIAELDDHLAGPTGLVLAGPDPLAAAKVLTEFAKEFQKPAVRIGLVDGKAGQPGLCQAAGGASLARRFSASWPGPASTACCIRWSAPSRRFATQRQAEPQLHGEGTRMPPPLTNDQILEAIGNKTVVELADLIEAFKSKFNVTVVAAAGRPAGGAGRPRRPPSRSRPSSRSSSRRAAPRRSRSSRWSARSPPWASRKPRTVDNGAQQDDQGRRVQGRGRGAQEEAGRAGRGRRAEVGRSPTLSRPGANGPAAKGADLTLLQ